MDEKNGKVACPSCQALNEDGRFFCYTCGHYLADDEGLPEQATRLHEKASQAAPPAKVLLPGGREMALNGKPTFIQRDDFDSTMPRDLLMCISRQHLLITYKNGSYFVEDHGKAGQGSTNHTRLNGEDIYRKGKQPLKDGDKIELAHQPELTVTFKMTGEDAGGK